MIRCRCGVYTDYGLTCTNCRQDPLVYSSDEELEEEPKEQEEEPDNSVDIEADEISPSG